MSTTSVDEFVHNMLSEQRKPAAAQPPCMRNGPVEVVRAAAAPWGVVGASPPMLRVRAMVEAAATSVGAVLIVGEAGTGRQTVARAIHAAAGGTPDQFVTVRTTTLPRHLIDAAIFGTNGAFGGALTAGSGTVLIDDVASLPLDVQAKLANHLAGPPGPTAGATGRRARILGALTCEPEAAVAAGTLRRDLADRLGVLTVRLPRLADRQEDVPTLVEHFLATFCSRRCGCIWGVSHEAMAVLQAAPWPGHVRELRAAIEHAVMTGTSGIVRIADLPAGLGGSAALHAGVATLRGAPGTKVAELGLPTLAEAELQLVRLAIERCGGNKVQAARALGISRHKLYDLLKRIDVAAPPA